MAELLFEILSEEIPARMQARAAEDLRRLVADGLEKQGLMFHVARSYATPRRLALVVDGLPENQPDVEEERRGPRVGSPEAALDGFLRSAGAGREQCVEKDTGKGVFWFVQVKTKGRPAALVAREVIESALAAFPWPKSMRWGSHSVRWVRPVQSMICLFAGNIVPVQFGPITAGNASIGHRFLKPRPFWVKNYADYRKKLRSHKVMLDAGDRRHAIYEGVRAIARTEGLNVLEDEGLLDEVAGLVEWPVPMLGRIDGAFMDVPREVLTTAMRSHQKYFALLWTNDSMAPRFALVANKSADEDDGAAIVAGNERVLRARLSDAKFFWDQDRKHPLERHLPKLAERVFHAKLGSMAEKMARVEKLAVDLARSVPGAEGPLVARAAKLAKADLSTGMVGEFPELQGVMGRYYALEHKEDGQVAQAIAEHYAPQGPNDICPSAPVSVAVALADKIDSLVGFFAVDERPTGSKDPFALRRAALGVIRLILENGLRISLTSAFRAAHALYGGGLGMDADKTAADLLDFFADRLKAHLREKGVRHDWVAAVFALGNEDDLVRLMAKTNALGDFLDSEDGANLLAAYRRASNILRIEEKKDGASYDGPVTELRLAQDEERALNQSIDKVQADMAPLMQGEKYADAMAALAVLRAPLDAFFDKVTVNCEDAELRANRLRLLARIRAAMGKIADFSKIEG